MTGYNPMDTRAQERASQERAKQAQQMERALSDDLNRIMSNKSGRRFVLHLLNLAGTYRSCFDPNALQMARMEGERNVGLKLQALIEAVCPDRYLEMLSEHMKHERSNDRPNAN
ncbi:Bbp19 family protein [Cupriavidus basilensis]|uniref:Bbp19 family protein n=1 Tax=Cupriavidus basilensis TaxID=68895 RepID=UPI0007512D01|nr:hypothetical protein [Cupriavidus basilensis]